MNDGINYDLSDIFMPLQTSPFFISNPSNIYTNTTIVNNIYTIYIGSGVYNSASGTVSISFTKSISSTVMLIGAGGQGNINGGGGGETDFFTYNFTPVTYNITIPLQNNPTIFNSTISASGGGSGIFSQTTFISYGGNGGGYSNINYGHGASGTTNGVYTNSTNGTYTSYTNNNVTIYSIGGGGGGTNNGVDYGAGGGTAGYNYMTNPNAYPIPLSPLNDTLFNSLTGTGGGNFDAEGSNGGGRYTTPGTFGGGGGGGTNSSIGYSGGSGCCAISFSNS